MNKTNSQASFTGKIFKKKNAIIILVILAITIGHFVMQISFIEREKMRIVESFVKTQPVINQNVQTESRVEEQIAENKSQDIEEPKTDVVLSPKPLKPQKIIVPEKIVQKELKRQPEPAPKQVLPKKEVKNESQGERLRRTEKILTGF